MQAKWGSTLQTLIGEGRESTSSRKGANSYCNCFERDKGEKGLTDFTGLSMEIDDGWSTRKMIFATRRKALGRIELVRYPGKRKIGAGGVGVDADGDADADADVDVDVDVGLG
ncbi:hypothetical protein ACJ73_05235 [Blastomyces percursus]|uniref:Uncharacterized protein n=1 Tax=Blastomyces percursus TaxID=1658174 RepID=A0A1J9Q5N4_9EURO|nr:hypothetical protein ACJ73_05235 [Blastomyces percursus]